MWGPPPPPRPYFDEAALRARQLSSANYLILAVILHAGAAVISWLLIRVAVQNSPPIPVDVGVLYVVATVGVIGQVAFAAIAGAGFYMVSKGGPNVAGWGAGLLMVGIIAVFFSILVFGGFMGIIGGALTAYVGNKVRKPPTPAWIPPSSWMPPPQPPTPPPSP
jgi:hypothetical protein